MNKPKLFIGSSIESLSIAYAIQENLKFNAETTVWDQDVFNLSESSLESLITALDVSDFGVFIFSPDDYVKIKEKKDLAVRDNVIFELGLFIGKLGRKRSFIIIPDSPTFHLPTDLIGFTPAKYESTRSDGNMQAATGSASNKIREMMIKIGPLKNVNETPELTDSTIKPAGKEKLDWVDHLVDKKDYKKAIEILKKKIRYTKDVDEKLRLKGWLSYAIFQTDAEKGNREYETLISENKSNNLSYVAYANNLIWINSLKKALDIIESGLSNCERKITLTNLKAKCLWETNQKAEAINLITETLDVNRDPMLFASAAEYYLKSDNKKAALNILHKGYLDYPRDENIASAFANVAYDLDFFELSVLLYKDLLDINPNNSYYWALLGNSYLRLDLYNLSLAAYEKASQLADNKEGWIYANMGNLYSNKNLYGKAEENLKIAMTIDNKSEYAHDRLSSVYKSLKEETIKVEDLRIKARAQLSLEILVS
jgi:Flp pilus assembly protein TadD